MGQSQQSEQPKEYRGTHSMMINDKTMWSDTRLLKQISELYTQNPKLIRTAHIPSAKLIKRETGREEKFGGKLPFMLKSETWPIDSHGNKMKFMFQLRDPRIPKDKTMYRFFLGMIIYDKEIGVVPSSYQKDAKLMPIILTTNNLKRQNKKIQNPDFFPSYKITSWKEQSELSSFMEIWEYFKNDWDYNIYLLTYNEFEKLMEIEPIYDDIKVGGTPRLINKEEFRDECDFVYITYSDYYPDLNDWKWGDDARVHITKNGKYIWDCD